jgi:hypothetical protein
MVEPLSHWLCPVMHSYRSTMTNFSFDPYRFECCCFLLFSFPICSKHQGFCDLGSHDYCPHNPPTTWMANKSHTISITGESCIQLVLTYIYVIDILMEWLIICIMQNYYGISMDTAKLKLCILRNSLQSFVSFVSELQVLVVALDRLSELQRPCGGCGSSQSQEVKDSGLYWKSRYATGAP